MRCTDAYVDEADFGCSAFSRTVTVYKDIFSRTLKLNLIHLFHLTVTASGRISS